MHGLEKRTELYNSTYYKMTHISLHNFMANISFSSTFHTRNQTDNAPMQFKKKLKFCL